MDPTDGKNMENIATAAKQQLPHTIALRHQLHQHPELSGNEANTAATIRQLLEQHVITCRSSNIGGHGLLTTIPCATPKHHGLPNVQIWMPYPVILHRNASTPCMCTRIAEAWGGAHCAYSALFLCYTMMIK